MKTLLRITIFALVALTTNTLAQDRVRLAAHYLDSSNSLLDDDGPIVKGYSAEVDVAFLRGKNFRASVAYNYQQQFGVNVYPGYFDGMMIVNLYRDPVTHYGGLQAGYTIAGAVEPFGGLFIGTRKVHEDAMRQQVRKWRFGVNVPFHKKSPFFVRGFYEFERPYGNPGGGFYTPKSRHIGLGGGFRF